MKRTGQLSFGDNEQLSKKKITRREKFLTQLDQLLPWSDMLALIEPHYPKSGRRGQQPIGLAIMLRIHLAQIAYNYSDPGMEEALYEIASLRHFCRIAIDEVPDETTILQFRRLLETHQLGASLFNGINNTLAARGLFLRQGTIVDASLIAAPTSTRNASGERDPEMHSSKKGNQWYFGAKVHIGVDDQTGLVHTLTVTSGHVADVAEAPNLLLGCETFVQGDAGYQGIDKRPELKDSAIQHWSVAMRPGKLRALTKGAKAGDVWVEKLKAVAHELSSRRAKVEHVFRDMKVRFAYAKVRYRGLLKNANRFHLLAALANVVRANSYERRKGLIAS